MIGAMTLTYEWRGEFTSAEAHRRYVDFEDHLRVFYFDTCGFRPPNAGLIEL